MSKLRVGVVGVGHIGSNHARLYSEAKSGELAAIYDIDQRRAEQLAKKYGVYAAASLEEFAERVDAASVATPTKCHFEVARALLDRGKHLLIEKPITENTADASALAQLALERQLVLQVGHVERFNPVLGALEERLTHPRFIEAHRLSPYPDRSTDIGVVLDLMIHDLEIILHLVRSPVQTIDAVGVPVLSRGEDIANARLRFENGCVANITSSRISPERMRKIRVFQEDAYLSLDYQKQTGEIYRRLSGRISREEVEIEREEPLRRQLASFIECATTGRAPKVSGFQATAALELAVEITKRIHADGFGLKGSAFVSSEVASMVPTKKVFFVAGEASGDTHGSELMVALRELDPEIRFLGRGGVRMSGVAGEGFIDWSQHSAVLGLWEVMKNYRYFRQQFAATLEEIRRESPDAVVLIDYPGFNLRLARVLRKELPRLKIIYYISPQVWAWNRRRIPQMARYLDLMLCIFPFEAQLYNQSGLRTIFVGHPMAETISVSPRNEHRDPNLIGLFPGSRVREIRKILPIMLRTAERILAEKPHFRFEVAAVSANLAKEIESLLQRSKLPKDTMQITVGKASAIMQRATAGIVASGTATMEAALFRLPFVLVYSLAWVTYIAAKILVKVEHIGMPNVLAGREIIPEFIQHRAQPKPIAEAVLRLMNNKEARDFVVSEFDRIISTLGASDASMNAARAIVEEIK